jgi:hypothetical protein
VVLPASDELLHLSIVELDTRNGPRRALVAAPKQAVSVGRARLEALRGGDFSSPINDRLLAAVDGSSDPIHLIILKAGGADGGHWRFETGLDEQTTSELGYYLIRSQLRLYREAAKRGVFNVIGVEFGSTELDAYGRGTDRLASELEREIAGATDSAIARFDLWLIDHVGLWSGASLQSFLRDNAADATAVGERHRRQIVRLLAEIDQPG